MPQFSYSRTCKTFLTNGVSEEDSNRKTERQEERLMLEVN